MKTRRLISIIVTLSMIASCFTFMAISGEAAAGDDISLTYNINGMTSISINTTDELSADKIGAYATHEIGIANSNGRCLVPVDGVYSERYSLDPDTPATYGSNAMFCGVVAEGTTLGHASRVAYNPYVAYEISADSGFAIDTLTVDLEYILMPYNHVRSEIGIFVTDDFDSNVNSETGEFDFSGSVLADVLEGYDRADSTANVDMRASQSGPMTVDLSSAVAKLSDTSSVYVIVVLMRGADQVARVRLYSLKFDATQKVSAGGSAGKDIVINAGIANVTPTSDLTGSMSPDDINAYYVHNCVVTPRTSSQANIITPSLGHTPQIMTGSYDLNPDKTFDGGEHVHYGALKEGSTIAGVRANLTVQNPYVCYKLNGDAGYVIDGLTAEIGCYLRIGSHENSTSDAAYYQVGIWVTDNFTIDENGIFDFSAIPYSHLISSSDTQATDTRNSPSTVDLSDAVRQLNSD
ncbi:MAG: hypothetical protein J5830_02060, partial [Clostridia bacterium]|nr:hypothetical protein [Clostridia bacterium]